MTRSAPFRLGAPGIQLSRVEPVREPFGERMDVCAFAGVAPRGPARVPVFDEHWPADRPCVEPWRPLRRTAPVAVESFAEYRRIFGAFEGPGLLPYAVATFFAQGGRRAYVARIVHDYRVDEPWTARRSQGVVSRNAARRAPPLAAGNGETIRLTARNEGAWGNGLRAAFGITRRAVAFTFDCGEPNRLEPRGDWRPRRGELLLARLKSGDLAWRYVVEAPDAKRREPGLRLDRPFSAEPAFAEVVEGELLIRDGELEERHLALGLSASHPRWIAQVLCDESAWVYPAWEWSGADIDPATLDLSARAALPQLQPDETPQFQGGADAYDQIAPEDFFDASWTFGAEDSSHGVHAFLALRDVASVCAPDLYSPEPLRSPDPTPETPTFASAEFARCVEPPPAIRARSVAGALAGLSLDPRRLEHLQIIIALQTQLAELAERSRAFVALLDVPLGLSDGQIDAWRARFATSYAAAYHPWLTCAPRDDGRDAPVHVPPSAAAAGILAKTEILYGVPHGPANELIDGVVGLSDLVTPARHDRLHPHGINVIRLDRDGARLTAGRTLSVDPSYRQLSVRRLMTQLTRTLERQMQWAVFEPFDSSFAGEVRRLITSLLRRWREAGALRGATDEESFFVRRRADLEGVGGGGEGALIVEVGVAPAEPLEFLRVRLTSDSAGTTVREE